MRRLLTFGLIGFAAQLIDGALGMAYGATSTTMLLSAGLAPAVASGTVHWPRSAPASRRARRIGASATSTGVGLFTGFMDAAGGGGWGPIGTPALLVAGVIAAPLAAGLVRLVPAQILGTAVGGFILLTNAQTLGKTIGLDGEQLVARPTWRSA